MMEMEGCICQPPPKGITLHPWAHLEDDGDETRKFVGEKINCTALACTLS